MARPPADPGAPVTAHEVARDLRALIDDLVSTQAPDVDLAQVRHHIDGARRALADHPRSRYWERDGAAAYRQVSPYRGPTNAVAPPMSVVSVGDGADVRVTGDVCVPAFYEGPPGSVHGGFLAGLFDEIMGATQAHAPAGAGVTGRLVVRYRQPTPLGVALRFTSWIERASSAFTAVAARCEHDDKITAEATGLFMRTPTRAAAERDAVHRSKEPS